jgi:hypothetical protein
MAELNNELETTAEFPGKSMLLSSTPLQAAGDQSSLAMSDGTDGDGNDGVDGDGAADGDGTDGDSTDTDGTDGDSTDGDGDGND